MISTSPKPYNLQMHHPAEASSQEPKVPFIGVGCGSCSVQLLGVLHDLGHLLQHGVGLHDLDIDQPYNLRCIIPQRQAHKSQKYLS